MSIPPRPTGLPSHIRPSSGLGASHPYQSSSTSSNSTAHANLLQTRINEKRAELESLRQLRDLSAGLAGQMEQLEHKLSTLSDGTEAVAAVLANWHTVLRAVYMASSKIPKPKAEDGEENAAAAEEEETPLPQTLVRIPVQQAEAAQRDREAVAAIAQGTSGE